MIRCLLENIGHPAEWSFLGHVGLFGGDRHMAFTSWALFAYCYVGARFSRVAEGPALPTDEWSRDILLDNKSFVSNRDFLWEIWSVEVQAMARYRWCCLSRWRQIYPL